MVSYAKRSAWIWCAPTLSMSGGRFGKFSFGGLVVWNGGSPELMGGFRWYRWCWDPNRCWGLKGYWFWIWINNSLVCWMRVSLVAVMEGSIGGWAGGCTAFLALGKRQHSSSCLPYLLCEVGGHWVWAYDPFGLVLSVFILICI